MIWVWIGGGVLVIAGLLYWHLILAEGSFLGPRIVGWIYDRASGRYDRIAKYNVEFEDETIGRPLARRLRARPNPLVLDVATGTGRLPVSLLRQEGFAGHIVGLDLSRGMLGKATENLAGHAHRVSLVRHDATTLPFPDDTFDAVTCLETLEFLPDQVSTIREMVRVLKPGGVFLATVRIGARALAFPGKRISRTAIFDLLDPYPFSELFLTSWEVNYDQVWGTLDARKPESEMQPASHCA